MQLANTQSTREDCAQDHTLQNVIDMEPLVFSAIFCIIVSRFSVQNQRHARKRQNEHNNKSQRPAKQNFPSPVPLMSMYCRAGTCGDTRAPSCT